MKNWEPRIANTFWGKTKKEQIFESLILPKFKIYYKANNQNQDSIDARIRI